MFQIVLMGYVGVRRAGQHFMRYPRYVEARLNTFLTRSTKSQQFALVPDAEIRNLCGYLLAVGAERFGLNIHAATVMSDHWHIEATDQSGRLPAFTQWFGSLLARAVNCYRRRSGAVFCPEGRPNHVYPRCEMSILDRIRYVMSNPVHHGAVRRARDWPGFAVLPSWYGESHEFRRPDFFFDPRGKSLPLTATLDVSVPPEYGHLSPAAFGALLATELAAHEDQIHAERMAAGEGYVGRRGCLRIPWWARAKEAHPVDGRVKEAIAREKDRAKQFRRMLRRFRRTYHETRYKWLKGDRTVEWPYGTWRKCRRENHPMSPGPEGSLPPP